MFLFCLAFAMSLCASVYMCFVVTCFVDLLCFCFVLCLVFVTSLCASVYMFFGVTCWERAVLLALVCDTIIAETTSHKHLGLTFSSTCTWNEHVNNISLKAWTRVNLLRALKFRVSRKSLEKLYISFIRPLLEYSDSVWDNCSSESKKQLEAIHTESARIVSGATKLCSIDKLFVELGWELLQSHRKKKHKLILFY